MAALRSRMKSEAPSHDLIITKEIKKYGIHIRNELGDWMYIEPKKIKFFDSGRKMKSLGYEFNVRDDINTLYIIIKE